MYFEIINVGNITLQLLSSNKYLESKKIIFL